MGTPTFSIPTLRELYMNDDIELLFAISKPDKRNGRGNGLISPPIKTECDELGIKCYQPERLKKDNELISLMKESKPDFLIVVAYGEILSKEILDIPKFGSINGHASLLPKYRGSSPIQYSLLNGDKITGVTTMLLNEGLDTGDILEQTELEIRDKMTSEELFNELKEITAKLISHTIINFENIVPKKQNDELATFTSLIKKEDGLINPNNEIVNDIYRKVYAFNPWPTAYINFNNSILQIYDCDITNESFNEVKELGDNLFINNKKLYLKCLDGNLLINELKPQSKKRMKASDYINGLNK